MTNIRPINNHMQFRCILELRSYNLIVMQSHTLYIPTFKQPSITGCACMLFYCAAYLNSCTWLYIYIRTVCDLLSTELASRIKPDLAPLRTIE